MSQAGFSAHTSKVSPRHIIYLWGIYKNRMRQRIYCKTLDQTELRGLFHIFEYQWGLRVSIWDSLCACMYEPAWMFALLTTPSRHIATVLSVVHLQPCGDSPHSVEVSTDTASLCPVCSRGCKLQTDCLVWLHDSVWDTDAKRREGNRGGLAEHKRQWRRLNQMIVHYC